MIIFFKNFPPEIKKYEIAGFIDDVINDCFLGKVDTKISIKDIETFTIQEVDSDTVEVYGLVRVFPKEVARRVIKKLNGALFKQKRITAREYFNRSVHNDPRHMGPGTKYFYEKRTFDRRRKPLMNAYQKNPILVYSVHL